MEEKPDQPTPDQPIPDQPKPDQPIPDQPNPNQSKLDQPKADQSKPDLSMVVKEDYDYHHILTPNPDWEEDLMLHTVVTPEIENRIRSYTASMKKKTKKEKPCSCSVVKPSRGVAKWRPLNDGKSMPSFGLGTWLGHTYSPWYKPDMEWTVEQAVGWAIDAGYRMIDTAYIYNTEYHVGLGIKNKINEHVIRRSDLFVVTKLWNSSHAKEAVVPSLKNSLHLLGLDYVDLYLIHWPVGFSVDHEFDQIDFLETWAGMREARAQGLTKSIGLSNFNEHMITRVGALSPDMPAVLQVEVNLNLQQPQLLNFCRENNIQVMAYSPMGSLFHARAAKDAPPPRTSDRRLVEIADRRGKSVPQIALRYLWELGVAPIPKSTTEERVKENINIFDFRLTNEERATLASYDVGYRTMPSLKWLESPFYPFEKEKYGCVEPWYNRKRKYD